MITITKLELVGLLAWKVSSTEPATYSDLYKAAAGEFNSEVELLAEELDSAYSEYGFNVVNKALDGASFVSNDYLFTFNFNDGECSLVVYSRGI